MARPTGGSVVQALVRPVAKQIGVNQILMQGVAQRIVLPAVLCMSVCACGNKGDLYLNPVELTDEQKSLLNELGNTENNVDVPVSDIETGVDSNSNSDSDSKEDNNADSEEKKKKSTTSESSNSVQ